VRLADDLKELVGLFVSLDVEFVVVGAFALGYHKLPRYTGDLDLFVRNSKSNAERIVSALDEFGFGSLGLTVEDFQAQDLIVQLGVEPNRVDLITQISGVSFAEAWTARELGDLDGISVSFLSLDLLSRNKEASGRDKDLVDLKAIRRRLQSDT